MNYVVNFIKVIGALAGVLGLFYLVVRLFKRNQFLNQTNQIQVLERCYLDTNQVLYLIKVADNIWLVSATKDKMEFIQQIELDTKELDLQSNQQLLNFWQKGKGKTDES
ncbi:flagellar biogenesis protein [Halobacteroides halobius DSM 5150]|uniref:Flagellar biogenesis protein n=1 Tax=Halobacteroides halobius (strain ATCC 35273 / DSM 5150 / MD-1) TaxID=748449 RepID=L0K6I4_HALHC|nr:flagellar biosynthetic protein FliO [Halobacteroides halobius]AGB40641.1 flagellar biogenesis protein [Halobacteroides halobius DSM 5150]